MWYSGFADAPNAVRLMLVKLDDDSLVPVVPSKLPTYELNPNASYIISGGLGGISTSISRWMVNRGARNLILLSRSTEYKQAANVMLKELREKGVRVLTPQCDVGDKESLTRALGKCKHLPPIKGCVQAAMVLQDTLFDNMSLQGFNDAIKPKSISGIVGNIGQSNYASGNTYQDDLAHRRLKHGEKATSIDLGNILNVGYVAEHEGLAETLGADAHEDIHEKELHAMLEYFCDPKLPVQGSKAQVVTALKSASAFKSQGKEEPDWMKRPMFRHFYLMDTDTAAMKTTDTQVNYMKLIKDALPVEEVAEIVTSGLQTKISKKLAIEKENVDTGRPMHSYGIDSLSAIEVRTWFRSAIGAEVTVFDILGNKSISGIATMVAKDLGTLSS